MTSADKPFFWLVRVLLFTVIAWVFSSGCTTSLLWNGVGNKEYRHTNYRVESNVSSLFLGSNGSICVPYSFTDNADVRALNKSTNSTQAGYYVIEAVPAIPSYTYFMNKPNANLLSAVVDGPIPLAIDEISINESRLTGYRRSRLEMLLQAVPYFSYSQDIAARDRIWERRLMVESKITIDLQLRLPARHVWAESDIESRLPNNSFFKLDDSEAINIMSYYYLVHDAIKNQVKHPARVNLFSNPYMKPVGWINAEGKIIGDSRGSNDKEIVGIAVLNEGSNTTERKNPVYIAIIFKAGTGSDVIRVRSSLDLCQSREDHFSKAPRVADMYGISERLPRYFSKSVDEMKYPKCIRSERVNSIKLVLTDEKIKRRTLPLPLKIILTPITAAADVVITPLYVAASFFIFERMPR